MKYKKLKLSTLLLFGLGITSLQAQEAIPTTGGNASGSGGSASYSLGQIVYTTNAGANGSVSQGVQQPYEISIVLALKEINDIAIELTAYPNPTTDYLMLKVDASTPFSKQSLTYELFDINGKLLKSKKITGTETEINMQNLVPANYFLKIIENNKDVKTFKIIKN